jgi:hypothetical protein
MFKKVYAKETKWNKKIIGMSFPSVFGIPLRFGLNVLLLLNIKRLALVNESFCYVLVGHFCTFQWVTFVRFGGSLLSTEQNNRQNWDKSRLKAVIMGKFVKIRKYLGSKTYEWLNNGEKINLLALFETQIDLSDERQNAIWLC